MHRESQAQADDGTQDDSNYHSNAGRNAGLEYHHQVQKYPQQNATKEPCIQQHFIYLYTYTIKSYNIKHLDIVDRAVQTK